MVVLLEKPSNVTTATKVVTAKFYCKNPDSENIQQNSKMEPEGSSFQLQALQQTVLLKKLRKCTRNDAPRKLLRRCFFIMANSKEYIKVFGHVLILAPMVMYI